MIAAELVHEDRTLIRSLVLVGTPHSRDIDLSAIAIPVEKVVARNDGIATPELIESTKRYPTGHTRWAEIAGADHSRSGFHGHQLFDRRASTDRSKKQRRLLEELVTVFESG